MLTSEKLKKFAKASGADLIGIAPIERFKDAPPDMHPSSIFPETKSVVVLACRLLKGSFRGIKEGTDWYSYLIYGYGPGIYGTLVDATYRTKRFIESFGWEAVESPGKAALYEMGPERAPVAPGKLPPDVTISMRLAAAAAGLGELGHSKVFLTPEFGPRQRFAVILTDAKLEPDPLYEGALCDDCMRCVYHCPGQAIGQEKTISVEIEGRTLSWADLDYGKCKLTHWGFNKDASPFMAKDLPGLSMDVVDQSMSWREAFDFGHTLSKEVEYIALVAKGNSEVEHGGSPGSICGARGCIQACVEHWETRKSNERL